MEVSKEMREGIRKCQSNLKIAIQTHQVWASHLSNDENNDIIKLRIKDAENNIISICRTQKEILDRLRRELECYRDKTQRGDVKWEDDVEYIAQQLKENHVQPKKRKPSISLLKDSVLNEIKLKCEDITVKAERKSVDESFDLEKFKKDSQLSISITSDTVVTPCSLQKAENPHNEPPATLTSVQRPLNIVENKRANFVNALNKVKNSILETSVTVTCIPKRRHSSPRPCEDNRPIRDPQPSAEIPSPSPSPPLLPPLPAPGVPIDREMFMRHLALIPVSQREEIMRKRSERKKRFTTSTNKNEFVYGGFEKRKKLNQFPYLQQHTPPQTRAKERLRRERRLQKLQKADRTSPAVSSPESPPSCSDAPAWIASLPSGLTVQPLFGNVPRKLCISCKNDTPSSLYHCTNCDCYFHSECAKESKTDDEQSCQACPSCSAEIPDSPPVTVTPVPSGSVKVNGVPSDELRKFKEVDRENLVKRNIQLQQELRRLQARSSSLQDKLNVKDEEKAGLVARNADIQQQVKKLIDFVNIFKHTSAGIKRPRSDSDSDHSKTSN